MMLFDWANSSMFAARGLDVKLGKLHFRLIALESTQWLNLRGTKFGGAKLIRALIPLLSNRTNF
jgi:hypothetical protein